MSTRDKDKDVVDDKVKEGVQVDKVPHVAKEVRADELPAWNLTTCIMVIGCGCASIIITLMVFVRPMIFWLQEDIALWTLLLGMILFLGIICLVLSIFVFMIRQMKLVCEDMQCK